MAFAAFDTLRAVETLREAGVEEKQAKAIANTMRDAVTEGVATKADLQAVVTDLKADIRAVVTDLKAHTQTTAADLKTDMLKVVVGIVVAVLLANVGVTFAIVRLLGGDGGQ